MTTPVALIPSRWCSEPYPPNGYLGRWSRCTARRGFPESDPGYRVVRQIAAASADKVGAAWVHSGTDGARIVVYEFNQAHYYDEDDATPADATVGTPTSVHPPVFANMGSPTGMSIRVNGADAPIGFRSDGSGGLESFLANLEAPNANWTATGAAGGSLTLLGTYNIRIAQIEVDGVTGTIVSGPSAVKTVTLTGANQRITVAHGTWTPNTRATHWRVGITADGESDSPANYRYSADIAIGTTTTNIDSIPTVTTPFESRNGFYKVADLTEIISGKHPRGIVAYEGRFVVWYKNTANILWSERDEWGWYSTNSLDTGAEGGWNLPVRAVLGYHGHLLVFTEASIHAVYGDFRRDVDGAAPTYAAQATPKTLVTGRGLAGGPLAAKIGSDGRVYFIEHSGPAVFDGTVDLLAPDDIRREWKSLDRSSGYPERWQIEEDPQTGQIWFLLTRKTNSARPMDGASTAGIPDISLRWIPSRGVWDAPFQLDIVHLAARTNGAKGATNVGPSLLMAVGPHGTVYELGFGNAGGVSDGVVTSTDYDGKLASANTTTTATIALAGISADALIGMTVTLRYPSGDSTYPYRVVQKTIVDNTATSGGNVTITWQGAVTVPSTSFWTVRLGGLLRKVVACLDPSAFGIPQATAASYYRLDRVEWRFKDKVGSEAAS